MNIVFNQTNNKGWTASTARGSLLSVYRVRDEFDYLTDEWKWVFTDNDSKQTWADHSSYSNVDAIEELLDMLQDKYNIEDEIEYTLEK